MLGGCLKMGDREPSNVDDANNGNSNGGASNSAPSIWGSPASSTKVGEAYSFTPGASDPDGDTLSFSIDKKPVWAAFNTSTGRLSGTPTLGDIGTYQSISISVSDGAMTDSLPPFGVSVDEVGTASTTLSWTAPSLNEDGTPLMDLSGYKIYYGKSSGGYTNQIRIDNPGITTYVVDNLTPDTYYFAATAFNASDIESRFSREAVKIVN